MTSPAELSQTARKCKEWLEKSPSNYIGVRSWCVKSVAQLLSEQSNLFMESSGLGDDLRIRSNSILGEVTAYPDLVVFGTFDKEVDTDFKDECICPYCGHEQSDSWEISNGPHTCGFCDQEFEVEKDYSVTFSTSRKA